MRGRTLFGVSLRTAQLQRTVLSLESLDASYVAYAGTRRRDAASYPECRERETPREL